MSNQSLFETLLNAGQLLEVAMNDVKVLLPTTGKRAIGTKELNGCSTVAILGSSAILLSHVSPLPTAQGWDKNLTYHKLSDGHLKTHLGQVSEEFS
jgi:hypothetical protein